MNQQKKTIGILGGMGPEASSYFYNLLIKLAHKKYKAVQDTDFPPVLIYNLPLFGFDETGIVDADLVQKQLVVGVQKLEDAGSDYIIIACNTVHTFYPTMQAAVKVPIINIVEETIDEVVRQGYTRVGIISSQSTKDLALYTNACLAKGLQPFSIDEKQQEKLNEIILHVMAGTQGPADTEILKGVIESLVSCGAQAVILGCTELPLAIEQSDVSTPIFNSNAIVLDRALAAAFIVN